MRSFLITASLLALAPLAAEAQTAASPAATADDAVYTGELMTRWGKEVTPENAWRLYPSPQMVRDSWLKPNGLWDYETAPTAATPPAAMDGEVLVDFPVVTKLPRVAGTDTPGQQNWTERKGRG